MLSYLRIDERMTPQEKRQQRYRERYKSLKPQWDDSVMLIERLFKEMVPSGAVVLDAGCGRSNYVLERNRARIGRIVGVDATPEAVDGNATVDEVVLSDLDNLPFTNGTFDAVISLWVLEHLHHPDRVFAEVTRVLKPGGVFLFVTPYSYSYVLLAKRLAGARLTRWILDRLYGRTEDDTFHTDYLANTERDIRRLAAQVSLEERFLITNEDPSYLAFNNAWFSVALAVQHIAQFLRLRVATMHIIGVYQKPRT